MSTETAKEHLAFCVERAMEYADRGDMVQAWASFPQRLHRGVERLMESINSTREEPQDWFFTFGYDHTHPDTGQRLHKSYVRIHGTCDSTRDAMFAVFGNRWAFQYASAQREERIDNYGMTEVAMPDPDGMSGE